MSKIATVRRMVLATVVVGMVVSQSQRVRAGWTGAMTGDGKGWASVTVVSSVLRTNTVKTVTGVQNPSASIPSANGYLVNGDLPKDSSVSTIARVKGTNGYVWSATTLGYNGDKADNDALEKRLTIIPADCAELTMDSSAVFAPDGLSGVITVNGSATAGTAILLRGFQWLGDTPPSSIEELEANSLVKWDVLYVGPFELNEANCTAIKIPFTTPDAKKLYFVNDGVAKSNPLIVNCPDNVVVNCGAAVVYPPVQYAGCGDITITYNPPAGSAFPLGTTPVTVTATDTHGNSATCSFTVTVQDTSAPVIPVLPTVTGSCAGEVTLTPPVATDACAGAITGTTTTVFPITKAGTNLVTWTFNDGNGNSLTATQTVIIPSRTFKGFYSPINGVGGSCDATIRSINLGSNIPIKFDELCGSTYITGGKPPVVKIQKWSTSNCVMLSEPVVQNAVYQNDWHYNWDTTGWTKGSYKIIVVLPDGTTQYAFVTLK